MNEVRPNDVTSFNGSSTLNHEDMFNVTDSGIGGSDIVNLVQIGMRSRNSTADTACAVKAQVKKTTGGDRSGAPALAVPTRKSSSTVARGRGPSVSSFRQPAAPAR